MLANIIFYSIFIFCFLFSLRMSIRALNRRDVVNLFCYGIFDLLWAGVNYYQYTAHTVPILCLFLPCFCVFVDFTFFIVAKIEKNA